MEKITKQSERWWRVPLSVSHHSRPLQALAMLLCAMMLLVPQRAGAVVGSDVDGTGFLYRFMMADLTYNRNNDGNSPYIEFSVGFGFHYMGYLEGFMDANSGLTISASKNGGSSYQTIINIKCNRNFVPTASNKITGCDLYGSTTTTTEYTVGTYYHRKVRWYLPLQWRNCDIKLKWSGNWCKEDGRDNHFISKDGYSISTPYTFNVRTISWNTEWSISPDSTITVPYKFEGTSRNTDGETHICTQINGGWSRAIGFKDPNKYANGSYTFNLKDIGMDFRTKFTITPYHEFTHDNDRDNKNSTSYYNKMASTLTFSPFPKAVIENTEFIQLNNQVKLTWKGDNTNYSIGDWDTRWMIYRNGVLVDSVYQRVTEGGYTNLNYNPDTGTYTYIDKDFPNETDLEYEIYYVWRHWPKDTKVKSLKSTTRAENANKVNTTRKVPVDNAEARSYSDSIVFTWTSDQLPEGWGHQFRIYVDNETTPIYTITPEDMQGVFKWIHRTTNQHNNRQDGIDENGVPYVEEPLNACDPHTYRIQGVVNDTELLADTAVFTKRAIGNGTLFYSLNATKGNHPGKVKLAWSVDLQGSTDAKTYVVERRTAEIENEAWTQLTRMSSKDENLAYDDDTPLPGVYYDYRVTVIDKCADGTEITNDIADIGFAKTTGTVSGRITYGSSGSSVEGVQVIAQKTGSSAESGSQYRSIHFTNIAGSVKWTYPNDAYAADKFSNGDFSIQLWLNPSELTETKMVRLNGETCYVGMDANGKLTLVNGESTLTFNNLRLTAGQYNHFALTRKAGTLTGYLISFDAAGMAVTKMETLTMNGTLSLAGAKQLSLGYYQGYADEFRLWTKCLTEDEVMENYDHLLVGNEAGLETYWTFDEGLKRKFFDYSRTLTVYHQHHGEVGNNAESDTFTPDELKLKAKTDIDGNYIIQGVPFSGEGTNFNIIPTLNSHEFSPQKQSRFISSSSVVHNSVDFTDVSSFEVSGTIIYAGTNIPVDSVQIYVDGRAVARDNEAVMTNQDGEFVIDVPIGKHYISAVRDGHTFVNNGRIPEDPTGLNEVTMEFKNPLSGLRFIDNTLVPVAGRVVGGAIEGNKPLGFGLSENNIGKAVITLEIPDTRYMMNAEEETDGLVSTGFRPVATNTDVPTIEGMTKPGVAYRTGGAYDNDAKKVVITTDGETGEFGVMLPPLDYKVLSVVMESTEGQANYVFNSEQLPRIDASDATTVLQDSVPTENGGFRYFDYVASFQQTLHTQPVLNVSQKDAPVGAFGDAKAEYNDLSTGKKLKANLYSVNNGTVTYNFNYPIVSETGTYKFDLEGYETYTNYDNGHTSKVPLKDVVVTISNAMSSSQEVYRADVPENAGKVVDLKSNQLLLDSLGKATYSWKAGLPNIQGDFTRTLNMTYNNGAGDYSWRGLTGIVFGDLPSGTNYVTEGPSKVEMILHDPYGDSSFATWETGSVTIHTKDTITTFAEANNFMVNLHAGADIVTDTHTLYCSVQNEYDFIADVSNGFDRTEQKDSIGSTVTTLEVTRAISTSADPEFVGADGDLYIGQSQNLLFGNARSVGLMSKANGTLEVDVDDVITIGTKFNTNFIYTEYQIENVIIPNLKTLRNDLLTQVADTSTFVNQSGATMYVTEWGPEDEQFGEPGTYKVLIVKVGNETTQLDKVQYYNSEIKAWQDAIALNEETKLNTFKDGIGKKNVSFGGGSEINESTTNSKGLATTISKTTNWTYNFFTDLGFTWNGMGGDVETTYNLIRENGSNVTDETENSSTFSYTLADSGADDSFSMDIYPAIDGHGPIFRTLGGQSSCPYEGEVLTKYYKEEGKSKVLSEATMQIEQPEIACDNNMLTGIPTGGQAQFELLLRNNSITKTDCYFNLIPVDGTNPLGARLSLPTGPIENGRTVLVPAGETVKMILTLEQGNAAITKYADITLALTSTCQDDLRSEVTISAEFVPASTPVIMAMDKTTVNTANVNDGVTFRVTGFNRYFAGLQSVDLQYKEPGKQAWSLLQSYIPGDSVRANNSQLLLPENGVIELPIDMREAKWADGTYQFRAQSSTIYSGKTVTAESDVLTLVKDLKRPQLFGAASPSDGVLNGGDEISVTFNEDIQKEMLTKNNIIVSGVLNGYELQHDVALSAQGTERAAYTQAGFNLAKKSFSADMWVRVTEAGDILTHGNGNEKFKLSIDANDKLVASIGGNDYVSTNAIEKDTWTFLTFSYNYDEGNSHLYARAVTANDTKDLFAYVAVADYAGSGSITLGQNFKGAIHELTLWDKARTMQEAQAEMYFTKKPSTPNLIGYWKMDEGNGTEIRDYARSRHLTMPASTWYLNNDNKAVTLDGTNTLKLNISACSPSQTDDYAVEMWFKGAKADQSAASTLFAANTNSVGIGFNANGGLTMKANGSDTELTSTNVLDNAWHHLALNVLRNGNATAYVDGKAVKTFSASAVPALEGATLYVGSQRGDAGTFFIGLVDEIRIWNASMTGDLLSSQRTQRLVGDESGLAAYYSFEKMTRDPNNGLITSVSNDEDLTGSGLKAEVVTSTSTTPQLPNYTDEAPALKVKPEATNVEYNYVANERGIIITLNETPARLEGTTLQFTVRAVQDLNGNESNAASWTAFVRQNSLLWKGETDVTLEKQVGEPATFEATFANESGTSENWTLTGLPSWLTASATSGTLKAQLSKTITFTVAESVPTGKYEETIYLTGNDNISEPLTLNLKVKAEEPDWAVTPAKYEETMNLVGNLQILNVPCRDEDDIVGAFINNECRGVVHPEYNSRYDSYFCTMTIYGDNEDNEKAVTFKVFEASTGTIYPVVTTSESITFVTNQMWGTYKNPIILNATDEVEQNIDLAYGWNWMSLAVKPNPFTVTNVFSKADSKVELVKNNGIYSEYNGKKWIGDLEQMNNLEMYTVQANEDLTLCVTGHKVKSDEESINIAGNGKWTWVAYNSLSVMSVNEALANMGPEDGEIIKGQHGVAYYDEYEWLGNLKQLTPGQGYKIQAKVDHTLTYPNKAATGAAARMAQPTLNSQLSTLNAQLTTFTPVDYRNYPANMVLIAQVVADGQPVSGAELGVFAGDECREAAVTDERGMIYITIPGDETCTLNFRVSDGNSQISTLNAQITYETDAVIGTPKAPFIIDLANATGIADNNRVTTNNSGDVYDLQGRKIVNRESENRKLRKGVYIVDGQKQVK